MKKQMGIDITMVICASDDSDITQAELEIFNDEFIRAVEVHGWGCGGAIGLVDVNDTEDDPTRELLVVIGTAHELSTLGLHEEAETVMAQALARRLRGSGMLATELTNEVLDETVRRLRNE